MSEVLNNTENKKKKEEGMVSTALLGEIFNESLKSSDNLGANILHGIVKTVKENKFAVGVAIAGLAANGIAKAFDLDNPLAVIGQEGLGLDAFVDNAGDLALLGAGAKLTADLVRNTKDAIYNPLSNEELLKQYAVNDVELENLNLDV